MSRKVAREANRFNMQGFPAVLFSRCRGPSYVTRKSFTSWSKWLSSLSRNNSYTQTRPDSVLKCSFDSLNYSSNKLGSCECGNTARALTQTRSMMVTPQYLNTPGNRTMENYLTNKKIPYNNGYTSILLQCPSCYVDETDKSVNNDSTKWTLFVNKTTGRFICKSCGHAGGWNELKLHSDKVEKPAKEQKLKPISKLNMSDSKVTEDARTIFESSRDISKYGAVEQELLSQKFNLKGISEETLHKFNVKFLEYQFVGKDGVTKEKFCMVVPWYDITKEKIAAVKLIPIDGEFGFKIFPRQSVDGLFGYHCLSQDLTQIVLTSSELDAMAIYEDTGLNAVSLPTGTSTLPPEILPQLEQFEKIVLWFGNDLRSKQAINQFSKKLDMERCSFVRLLKNGSPNGALDALNKGDNLKSIIFKAQSLKHKEILTFNQLREDVLGEFINAEQVAGVKWKRFPGLNETLKGHRRGELTILTGQTGTGKTTLLSELSLDLCAQGVNTLWGSFEIRNVRLVKAMLCQYSGLNLETSIGQYNYWADKFDALPLYFMSYFGSHSMQTVLETMSHAAYVYDIDHIIIDNLQFMMSSETSKFADRFNAMDFAITALRNFASSKNVHVTLVIHPRKENQDSELQTASIFGTAKASQEADNIIILQDPRGRTSRRYLQVTKNRFDGMVGKVPLQFNRDSLCMSGFRRDENTGEGMIQAADQARRNQDWDD